MNGNQIAWHHSVVVGYSDDGRPVFYKTGTCDSSVTLPTGATANDLADGSIIRFSDNGVVKTYNKKTDAWITLFELS